MANFDELLKKRKQELEEYRIELEKAKTEQESAKAYMNIDSNIGKSMFINATENVETFKKKIIETQNEINKLKNKKIDNDIVKKNQIETLNTLKSAVIGTCNAITSTIAKAIQAIKTANSVIAKTVNGTINIFNTFKSTVERILGLFGGFGNRIRSANNDMNIFKGSFTELKSIIDIVANSFNKLFNNKFINEGKGLLSSIQTLNMLIGTELTESTIEWANNLEQAFGLSAAGLISDLKELTAVMYGLGMSAKDVQIAATNLEAVAMSLSATTGYDFSTVVNKIQSGMKGMTQSIDDLGLSVRESQMDAFLKKLKAQGGEFANIGTSFSSLTEQQRIYVRYAAIMDQFMSKPAYTAENYAKSLDTITGRLSILNSQLRALTSTIGVVALNIFNKIIQPITYVIYYINILIKKAASLLGISTELSATMNGSEPTSLQDTKDSLDEISKSAEKAKGSLDTFDHVSSTNGSNSNSSGGNDAFDYSKLMDFGGNYAKLLDELGKENEKYLDKCKKTITDWLDARKLDITNWYKNLLGRDIDWGLINSNLKQVTTNLKNSLVQIKKLVNNVIDILGGIGLAILDDLNFTSMLTKLSRIILLSIGLINSILDKIKKPLMNFYNNWISPYVKNIGKFINNKLQELTLLLLKWFVWWNNPLNFGRDNKIESFFDNLGKKIKEIIILGKTLFGKQSLDDTVFIRSESTDNMNTLFIIARNIHTIFESLKDTVKQVFVDLYDGFKGDKNNNGVADGLDYISEKLGNISEWISNNKDTITELIEEILKCICKIADAEFDKIMELLHWITTNKDTVISLLDKITNALVFIIEHIDDIIKIGITAKIVGLVSNLGLLILKIKTMKTLLSNLGSASLATEAAGATVGATGAGAGIASIAAGAGVASVAVAGITASFKGVKEAINNAEDSVLNFTSSLGKIDGNTITTKTTKTWAYDIRKALEEIYNKDIPTDGLDRSLKYIECELRKTGQLSEYEIKMTVDNIEKQYNRIGKISVFDDLAYKNNNSANNIECIKNALNGTQTEVSNTTKSLETLGSSVTSSEEKMVIKLENLKSETISTNGAITNNFNTLDNVSKTTFNNISKNLNNPLNDALRKIREFTNNANMAIASIKIPLYKTNSLYANTSNNNIKWWNTSVKSVKGFANGGVPKSGSIFYANENGNIELAGNFGGYSGVANQDMIIKSMQDAIEGSMYKAIKAAIGNNNSNTVVNNFEICNGGMFVGNEASFNSLANKLTNRIISNNGNIANIGLGFN